MIASFKSSYLKRFTSAFSSPGLRPACSQLLQSRAFQVKITWSSLQSKRPSHDRLQCSSTQLPSEARPKLFVGPPKRFFSDAAKILPDLIISPSCVARIKALQEKRSDPDLKLRIMVEGGGCSGFQYVFEMQSDGPDEEDRVFEKSGVQVIVDEASMEFVRGATIDYVTEMIRSSFAITANPNSDNACGCGSSFALKNFEENPAID